MRMLHENQNDSGEQRNLFIALGLVALIIFGIQFYFAPSPEDIAAQQDAAMQAEQLNAPSAPSAGADAFSGAGSTAPLGSNQEPLSREALTAQGDRVTIEDVSLTGSLNLKGAFLDDILLPRFTNELDPASGMVEALQPSDLPNGYFVELGWLDPTTGPTQSADDVWRVVGNTNLTRQTPVTIELDKDGFKYQRSYSIESDYLVRVKQTLVNMTGAQAKLTPYARARRLGQVETEGNWLIHEGIIGHADGSIQQVDYDDIEGAGDNSQTISTEGGWIGFTDKYWLTAVMPANQSDLVNVVIQGLYENRQQKYEVGFIQGDFSLSDQESVSVETLVFVGAKKVELLDQYTNDFGIQRFDMAIDYGWFYYLTKPFAKALIWIEKRVGNFGWSIAILTLLLKLLFFPLAWRAYVSMAAMRRLAPKIQEFRELYGDDRARISQETMSLYRSEGANPLSGCLPMLLQIPVFFALYKTLFVTIEMRHAPFFGWIQDLSAPDPTSIFNLFGLLPYAVPDLGLLNLLSIGIWPLIMGVSMWAQQKLNPPPADPQQAMIFNLLPIVFTFMLATFPAGLVIYWTANNVLTFIQQFFIMRFSDNKKAAEVEARSEKKPAKAKSGGQNANSADDNTDAEQTSEDLSTDADDGFDDGDHQDAEAAVEGKVSSAASAKKRAKSKGKRR